MKTYELHVSTQCNQFNTANADYKKLVNSLQMWLNTYNTLGVPIVDIYRDLGLANVMAQIIYYLDGIKIGNDMEVASLRNFQLVMGLVVAYLEKRVPKNNRWTLQGILDFDISSVLCLLVDMAIYYKCKFPIPSNVSIAVICKDIIGGAECCKTSLFKVTDELVVASEKITAEQLTEKSAFNQLIQTKAGLDKVADILITFVNTHLEVLGISVSFMEDIRMDKLIMLVGVLGNFFVPMDQWFINTTSAVELDTNLNTFLAICNTIGVDLGDLQKSDFVEPNPKVIAKTLLAIQQKYQL